MWSMRIRASERDGDRSGRDRVDDALVRARCGDEAGFLVLWDALQPRLLRYLQVIGCDDVDDVAGETWLQVVRDLPKFKKGGADEFRAWLFTIGAAPGHRRRTVPHGGSATRYWPPSRSRPSSTPGNPVEDEVLQSFPPGKPSPWSPGCPRTRPRWSRCE